MKNKILIIISIILIIISIGGGIDGRGIQNESTGIYKEAYKEHRQEPEKLQILSNSTVAGTNSNMDSDIYKDITADEYKLLIKIVYLEARGESKEGKAAVVRTIMNRVKSEEFPNSIEEVIYQTGQFQPAKYLENLEVEEVYIAEIEEAVHLGLRSSGEEMYFVNSDLADRDNYNWMKNNLTYLYTEEGHEFYR